MSDSVRQLEKLQRRWKKKTGDDMPPEIARLEIELVQRAVERTEKGEIVFLQKDPVSKSSDIASDASLRYWDTETA